MKVSITDAYDVEQAHLQLKELLPTKNYKDMSTALSVSFPLWPKSTNPSPQAVVHLITPLRPLNTIAEVAELFKSAEDARKTIQEKVAAEMDIL